MSAPKAQGKQKTNPVLLVILGLLLVAGVLRFAMPSLFGAGPLHTSAAVLKPYKPKPRPVATATPVSVVRTSRNPFTP